MPSGSWTWGPVSRSTKADLRPGASLAIRLPTGAGGVWQSWELVALVRGQQVELMAIRVLHHYPVHLASTGDCASRSQADQSIGLGLSGSAGEGSEVEVQSSLAGVGQQWWTTPGDLRTAERRTDRRLLIVFPDQWPAQGRAPEVADLS